MEKKKGSCRYACCRGQHAAESCELSGCCCFGFYYCCCEGKKDHNMNHWILLCCQRWHSIRSNYNRCCSRYYHNSLICATELHVQRICVRNNDVHYRTAGVAGAAGIDLVPVPVPVLALVRNQMLRRFRLRAGQSREPGPSFWNAGSLPVWRQQSPFRSRLARVSLRSDCFVLGGVPCFA